MGPNDALNTSYQYNERDNVTFMYHTFNSAKRHTDQLAATPKINKRLRLCDDTEMMAGFLPNAGFGLMSIRHRRD
jgi:hypothetical protein